MVAEFYTELRKALGAVGRLFSILSIKNTLPDQPDAVELQSLRGDIQFERVDFSYQEDQPVLRGLSFTAWAGQIVALVGPSGAGKTTIANLLLRFYDVTGGFILLDGIDIRQIRQESLRRHIALVPQDPALFGGSIHDNIAYGRLDASREEIMEAARMANAHDFIQHLPDGYDSIVGERGVKLSGGQRQRIAIARAIIRRPRLLILDEATSSLDSENEAAIQEALGRLMKTCTTLVIAHRLSTIEQADAIVVIEAGQVAEEGTHQQLIQREGLYWRLYTQSLKEQTL